MSDAPSDTWEKGGLYERFVGRWSRRVAPPFLAWLNIPTGRRWLDVGCGTGALSAAIVDRCAPASIVGVDPADGFLATAKGHLGGRVTFRRGDATAIPLVDASVDVVVSGLVLNFVPDLNAALHEMARVTAVGGTVAAYVWDYADKMELLRYFWDAAAGLDGRAAELDEAARFPVCRRDALAELFRNAGLGDVAVTALDVPTPFANFDDYWQPFLGGQGPAPTYAMSLPEATRRQLRDRLRARLPAGADGSISLIARVWAVRGAVSK
jgi:SAM-dependent methyltransferase